MLKLVKILKLKTVHSSVSTILKFSAIIYNYYALLLSRKGYLHKKIAVPKNIVFMTQFKNFQFIEKSCFLLEIFNFNTLNHSINFKSFHVMMSISTQSSAF